MTGQTAVGVVIPQDRLRPIRHMFVAERAGAHGLKDGGTAGSARLKGDFDRRPVAVLFIGPLGAFFPDRSIRQQRRAGAESILQIPFKRCFHEDGHGRERRTSRSYANKVRGMRRETRGSFDSKPLAFSSYSLPVFPMSHSAAVAKIVLRKNAP